MFIVLAFILQLLMNIGHAAFCLVLKCQTLPDKQRRKCKYEVESQVKSRFWPVQCLCHLWMNDGVQCWGVVRIKMTTKDLSSHSIWWVTIQQLFCNKYCVRSCGLDSSSFSVLTLLLAKVTCPKIFSWVLFKLYNCRLV